MELRPGITNPQLWYPERPPRSEWNRIRKVVLERDDWTCCFCGHRATKYMNVHHVEESLDNLPENLTTSCVACHAVLHMGRNLDLGIIEIWQCPKLSQVEIIQLTRSRVERGQSLAAIKKSLPLKRGPLPPTAIEYANELVRSMGDRPRAQLEEPLAAAFVALKRWQIEQPRVHRPHSAA